VVGVVTSYRQFKGDKKAYLREWRLRNPDNQKQWVRQYRIRKPAKYMLKSIKEKAKKRNIPFNLSEEDIVVPEYCPILGVKLEYGNEDRRTSPSIDRLIPELGYTKGNVAVISAAANSLKSNLTLEQIVRMGDWAKGHMNG
jgi:hypothetical protein